MVTHYRIDREHSNAYEAWKEMGSPQQPTPQQYAELERAGRLEELSPPKRLVVTGGRTSVTFSLPRQAVSLVKMTW